MKQAKRLLAALLAALLTLSLAACNNDDGGKVDIPTSQTGSDDFQKNPLKLGVTIFKKIYINPKC